MSQKKLDIEVVSLDANGRVVMSDEVLDMMIADPDLTSAGANGGFINSGCTNQSCIFTINTSCTNVGNCGGSLNIDCPPVQSSPAPPDP